MTPDQHISVGIFPGFSWIRCEGKGSLLNSTSVKAFGDERIANGETLLVMDLDECTGMDSTFMGTLAGLATRIASKAGGELHIAEAGERNRNSLEDLGLDFLMPINPPAAAWRGKVDEVRSQLKPQGQPCGLPISENPEHILTAHKTLSGLNPKNEKVFEQVVSILEQQMPKEPSPTDQGESPPR